jgi:hypothetical protein
LQVIKIAKNKVGAGNGLHEVDRKESDKVMELEGEVVK